MKSPIGGIDYECALRFSQPPHGLPRRSGRTRESGEENSMRGNGTSISGKSKPSRRALASAAMQAAGFHGNGDDRQAVTEHVDERQLLAVLTALKKGNFA